MGNHFGSPSCGEEVFFGQIDRVLKNHSLFFAFANSILHPVRKLQILGAGLALRQREQ
jgi:hypothetical protein